jgi:hypothetical protein
MDRCDVAEGVGIGGLRGKSPDHPALAAPRQEYTLQAAPAPQRENEQAGAAGVREEELGLVGLTRSAPGTHRDDLACRYRWERLPAGDRPNMGPRHRVMGDTREQAPQFDRRGEFAVLREDGVDRAGDGVGDQEHGPQDAGARRSVQATLL